MSGGGSERGHSLRVLQISDCHLAADPAIPYRGRSADAGLEAIVDAAVDWRPDLVLLTGDLSEDASPESYRRLVRILGRCPAPFAVLPGNHDDAEEMERHFGNGGGERPRVLVSGRWRIVLLRSDVAGWIDGIVDDMQLVAIQAEIDRPTGQHLMLALHHHPVAVGSPWIDRYMLRQPGALLQLLERNGNVRGVVWGHAHQAFEQQRGGTMLLGCPSSAANSLPGCEKFTDDPAGPACRWLELGDDGSIVTGLLHPCRA